MPSFRIDTAAYSVLLWPWFVSSDASPPPFANPVLTAGYMETDYFPNVNLPRCAFSFPSNSGSSDLRKYVAVRNL